MPKWSSSAAVVDVAYIALGSNLGDRSAHLARARAALAALTGSRIVGASAVEETAPIGPVPQPAYLNQIVALETSLAPHALLDALLAVEAAEGRTRSVRWGSRTLDLDIVDFDRQRVSSPSLIVPHPELPNRSFWQRELAAARTAAHENSHETSRSDDRTADTANDA